MPLARTERIRNIAGVVYRRQQQQYEEKEKEEGQSNQPPSHVLLLQNLASRVDVLQTSPRRRSRLDSPPTGGGRTIHLKGGSQERTIGHDLQRERPSDFQSDVQLSRVCSISGKQGFFGNPETVSHSALSEEQRKVMKQLRMEERIVQDNHARVLREACCAYTMHTTIEKRKETQVVVEDDDDTSRAWHITMAKVTNRDYCRFRAAIEIAEGCPLQSLTFPGAFFTESKLIPTLVQTNVAFYQDLSSIFIHTKMNHKFPVFHVIVMDQYNRKTMTIRVDKSKIATNEDEDMSHGNVTFCEVLALVDKCLAAAVEKKKTTTESLSSTVSTSEMRSVSQVCDTEENRWHSIPNAFRMGASSCQLDAGYPTFARVGVSHTCDTESSQSTMTTTLQAATTPLVHATTPLVHATTPLVHASPAKDDALTVSHIHCCGDTMFVYLCEIGAVECIPTK